MIKVKSYSPEIEAIHKEFETYATNLASKSVVWPSPEFLKLKEEVEKLRAIGAHQCKDVVEFSQQEMQYREAEEVFQAV